MSTAGLLQSHAALKEHSQLLESTLADRASTDVRIDSEARGELSKLERALSEANSQLQQLDSELAKERQGVKDARAQVIVTSYFWVQLMTIEPALLHALWRYMNICLHLNHISVVFPLAFRNSSAYGHE